MDHEAQGSLQHSRMLEAVLAASRDQVYVVDRAGRVLYASPAGAKALGLDPATAFGRTGAELNLPSGILQRLAQGRESVLKTGGAVRDHIRFPAPDGPREYDCTFSPLFGEADEVKAIICTATDVTEARRAEESARRQADQLRLITDASPSLIAYIDPEQRYRFCNSAYVGWLGHAPKDLTGRHVRDVLGPVAYAAVRDDLETALSGQAVTVERQMDYQSAAARFAKIAFVPDRDEAGQVRGVVAVVTDITERRDAERRMLESEQRYRSLFDYNNDAVCSFDLGGNFQSANAACTTLLGYPLDELLRLPFPPIIAPEDRDRTLSHFGLAAQGQPQNYEIALIHKSGSRVAARITNLPIIVGGRIVGVYGIAEDVTERKRLEEERERLLAEAERRADQEKMVNRIGLAIRSSLDPDVVQETAAAVLGKALRADRCYFSFFDIDEDTITVVHDFHRSDLPSIAGGYVGADFRPLTRELQASQRTQVINDVRAGGYGERTEAATGRIQIRACIRLPLFHDGQLMAVLAVAMAEPRAWTPGDVALVEAVGAQTRVAVENALLHRRTEEAARRQRAFLRDVLASVTDGHLILCSGPDDLPTPLAPSGGPIGLTQREGLATLRRRVGEAAAASGLTEERRHDLITAANEAAMNAIVHAGGGTAQVRHGSGTVQVCVEDHGTGIAMENLPRATLARGFSTKATLGHGFKMMLETADRVFLLTGAGGTTVVMEQSQVPPPPDWLRAA